jgi:hypothetical protein
VLKPGIAGQSSVVMSRMVATDHFQQIISNLRLCTGTQCASWWQYPPPPTSAVTLHSADKRLGANHTARCAHARCSIFEK